MYLKLLVATCPPGSKTPPEDGPNMGDSGVKSQIDWVGVLF